MEMATIRIYHLAVTLLKYVYLNLVALLFTFAGIIIFGLFPALVATFHIIREWQIGNEHVPIWKTFIKIYKKAFVKSNLAGWGLGIVTIILFINLNIAEVISHPFIRMTYYPILTVLILFSATCLLIIPMYLHYQMKFRHIIKNAFLFLFIKPLYSLLLLSVIFIYFYLMKLVPGLILFIGITLFAWVVIWISLKIFDAAESIVERKQESELLV